jgi:plasmid stability protein
MHRTTISIPDEMFTMLRTRARDNHRSFSSEVIFLLENALAAEMDISQSLLSRMLEAQGEPRTE